MPRSRQTQLTPEQIACLRLVLENYTSKQIARHLEISPFSVDKRLARAVAFLNADDRFHAARIYMASLKTEHAADSTDNRKAYTYEQLVYNPQALDHGLESAQSDRVSSDQAEKTQQERHKYLGPLLSFFSIPKIEGDLQNDSAGYKVASIIKIALFGAIAFATVVIILKGSMQFFTP